MARQAWQFANNADAPVMPRARKGGAAANAAVGDTHNVLSNPIFPLPSELHADAYANTENGQPADNPAPPRAGGLRTTKPAATASLAAAAAAGHDCQADEQNG